MTRVEIHGAEEVRKAIEALAGRYPRALGGAIYKLGVSILSDALPRTPVEYGPLRASHYASPPTAGASPEVELGYGTAYAPIQHEGDFRHPRGGERKFLEHAINAQAPGALERLRAWTDALERTGGGFGGASMPTAPRVATDAPRSASQAERLARAGRNVRARTGR